MARPPPAFEVVRRDGPARLGRLRLDGTSLPTPGILPVSRTPWMGEFRRRWQFRGEEAFEAGGLRVSTSPRAEADLYLLPKSRALEGRPRRFMEGVAEFREAVGPDGALYLPALATPANAALLAYAGVDLVDDVQPLLAARQGLYMTPAGSRPLGGMEEMPCPCDACRRGEGVRVGDGPLPPPTGPPPAPPSRMDAEALARHNTTALEMELRAARAEIRRGRMRERAEERVRAEAWQVAALRNFDAQGSYLERRSPVSREARLDANSMESLFRPEVRRFAARVRERFTPAPGPWVLLPCSARKPYSNSQSHRRFRRALEPWRGSLQEVVLTSPLGVVPRELERTYPAAHYETPVTGRWDGEERLWLQECLRPLLEKHRPPLLFIHIPGTPGEVAREEGRRLGIETVETAGADPAGDAALQALHNAVASAGLPRAPHRLGRHLRAVADFQLGPGAGELLMKHGKPTMRGARSGPPVAAIRSVATLTPSGLLALTLKGARALAGTRWPGLRVEIDDFLPTGSVLAPGVTRADEALRPGDEAVFEGPRAFGVGKAAMAGWEMERARRGVAIRVREVEPK
ncbi:MAG: archaeosine synthase subunit alpha [Halobacteria archaeon]